jgi:hypothetical protein
MKKLVYVLLIGFCFVACGDYKYEKNSSGIFITKYQGNAQDIAIPEMIKELPVVGIGYDSFRNKQLTSVTIPGSITYIGSNAFSNNQLTNVIIPDSVTRIDNSAFRNNQITSVTIPKSVTEIGENAFEYNQLTSVTIPDNITKISRNTFSNNQLANVTIPKSVTEIGQDAFSNNQLTSIIIPDSVTFISRNAFNNNLLSSLIIPNSITEISQYTFSNNQLSSITIPNSVKRISENAFINNHIDNQLTKVAIMGSNVSCYRNSFDENVLINDRTIESYRNIEFETDNKIFASNILIINYNTNTVLVGFKDNGVELGIRFNDGRRKTGTMRINRIMVGGRSIGRIVDDNNYNIVIYALDDSLTFEIIDGQDENTMNITLRGKEYHYKERKVIIINRTYERL